MAEFYFTNLNPNAMVFIPSHIRSSNLNPEAAVYVSHNNSKWNSEVTQVRKELNPEAKSFIPFKRLNPNAKDFTPTTNPGVDNTVVVKFGEKGAEKCAADEPWKGIGKPNPMSQSKDQEELMTQLDVESCDSNYWQFWRHRFTEHKKLPIEGLEYYKFYL
ncbi:unnamed protein product [Orchesella dallaii]|uniref:Uncharacterized protein n=1 Tax=Orchesella dallaii TaxID=48710 RepID=A0ABP1R414_9HEXA